MSTFFVCDIFCDVVQQDTFYFRTVWHKCHFYINFYVLYIHIEFSELWGGVILHLVFGDTKYFWQELQKYMQKYFKEYTLKK